MSPDRDLGRRDDDGRDMDDYADEAPRSIFAALWFRALLAVLVLGILAAVAVPYVLDFATSPRLKTSAAPVSTPPPTASPAAAPAAPTATAVAPATPAPPRPLTPEPAKSKPAPVTAAKLVAKATKAAMAVDPAPKQAPKAPAIKPSSAKAAAVAATGGPYWVQVGAFREPETAKRLAASLREQGLRTEESTTGTVTPRPPTESPTGGSSSDRYDVVVSGASAADVNAKLATKGMTGEIAPNGVVVRPSLPLREAVALSRDLADGGLSVQVRRVGGPAPVATPASAPAAASTLYRVRVGGFPDRATAVAAAKQLEEKGFKPFIARGKE